MKTTRATRKAAIAHAREIAKRTNEPAYVYIDRDESTAHGGTAWDACSDAFYHGQGQWGRWIREDDVKAIVYPCGETEFFD